MIGTIYQGVYSHHHWYHYPIRPCTYFYSQLHNLFFENEKSSFVHTMLHSPFTSLSKNQSSPHIKQLKRIRHPFMHHICLYRRRKGLYQSITLSNKLLRVGIITNLFHQILIWNWENYGYSPPTLLVDTVLSQLWNQLESSS